MRNIAFAALFILAMPASGETIVQHAAGSFAPTIVPQPAAIGDVPGVARMMVTKVFAGGLAASGEGVMLASGSGADSGAYVLIERVSGILDGKAGSFAMMHDAVMEHGKPDQHIVVVPGSGSGALAGIAGSMTMRIEGGTHYYDLAYTLAPR